MHERLRHSGHKNWATVDLPKTLAWNLFIFNARYPLRGDGYELHGQRALRKYRLKLAMQSEEAL
jgi:hypothetical protein